MKKCLNCGETCKEEVKFCPNCGSPLNFPENGELAPEPEKQEEIPALEPEKAAEQEKQSEIPALEQEAAEAANSGAVDLEQIAPLEPEKQEETPVSKQETQPDFPQTPKEQESPAQNKPETEEQPSPPAPPNWDEQNSGEAAGETVPPPPGRKKPRKRPGVLSTILCVPICVLLICSLLALTVTCEIRFSVSRQRMRELVAALDPLQLKVSDVLSGGGEEPLCKALSDAVKEGTEGRVILSERDIAAFFTESPFADYIAEKAYQFLHGLAQGGESVGIIHSELATALRESRDFFLERAGVELTRGDCGLLALAAAESGVLDNLNEAAFREAAPELYFAIRATLSWWGVAALTALSLLLAFLLILCARGFLRTLTGLAWVLTGLGVLLAVPPIVYKMYPAVWKLCCGESYLLAFLSGETLLSFFALPALAVLGAGLLLIALTALVRAIRRTVAAKRQRES